jgi:hypothetical protein
MKTVTLQLNIDDEINAMEQQVLATWSNVRDIRPALQALYAQAAHDSRAFFEDFEPSMLCRSLSEARVAEIKKLFDDEDQKDLCGYYDSVANTLRQIDNGMSYVLGASRNIDGPWDFSEKLTPHFKVILKKYPSLAHASPKLDAEHLEFQGCYIGAVRSHEFFERITPQYVEYEVDGHGKGSAYVLIGAAYAHFMGVSEKLNTLALMRDIQSLFDIAEPVMKFGKIIDGSVGNKLLDTLISLADPMPQEKEFVDEVANMKAFRTMTPQERAQMNKTDMHISNEELDRLIDEHQKDALKAVRRHFRINSKPDHELSVAPR